MKKLLWSLIAAVMVFSAEAGNYLVQCAKMPIPGGWGSDGKGLMSATDRGNTLSGEYELPESGTYYVWLKTASFGQNWRKSSVVVNGKNLGKAGDEKLPAGMTRGGQIWGKIPKSILLKAGKISLQVVAETPNSRVVEVLFTTDRQLVPDYAQNPPDTVVLESIDRGEFAGELKFRVSLDRPMISYKLGEPVVFTIDPRCDGKTVDHGFVRYDLEADYGYHEEKVLPCTGAPLKISATLDRPGFIRLRAELLNSQQQPVNSADGVRPIFSGGAGVAIDRIPSVPEPADFDAFWARQVAKLKAVPLQPTITEYGTSADGKYRYFSVSAPCPGPRYRGEDPRPMTGIVSIPVGAAPGSLKAKIHFPGYGGRGGERTKCATNAGYITMSINAHGMDIGKPTAYYDAFEASRGGYALRDGDDPENCYFNGMVLRMLRALEFIKSLPEWNGKDLEAIGSSQGGLHALWAAGLDPAVSYCVARIPWGCNMGETTLGLMGRDRVILKYAPARGYYDPVNFAKRIKCPVNISRAGLGDYTCPPSGIARVYYNLQCPKEITWVQNSEHPENYPPDSDRVHLVGNAISE